LIKFFKYPLLICTTLISLTGCISDDTDVILGEDEQNQEKINLVNGQIYSVNSLAAIQGVDIKLLVNGIDYRLASSAAVEGDIHTDGYFSFEDVPLGQHTLIIEHPGFATITRNITFTENDNSQIMQLGKIGLTASIQMDVLVSSVDGNIENAVVQAELISPDYFCTEGTQIQLLGTEDRISAVTNSDGIATLENLSSCGIYRVVVPAVDTNNDGIFDYSTAVTDDSYYNVTRNFSDGNYNNYVRGILPQTIPGTLNIFLEETEYDYSVQRISSNFSEDTRRLNVYKDDQSMGNQYTQTLTSADKVEFRFNYPVDIKREVSIEVMDLENSEYNNISYIELPIVVELDTTETILTITAVTGSLPNNVLMKVFGSVVAKGKADSNSLDLLSSNYNNYHIITYSDDFDISATSRASGYYGYIDYVISKPVTGTFYAKYLSTSGQERTENMSLSSYSNYNFYFDTVTKQSELKLTDSIYSWNEGAIEIEYELEDEQGSHYQGEFTIPAQTPI